MFCFFFSLLGSHATYFTDLYYLNMPFVEILAVYFSVSVLCHVGYVLDILGNTFIIPTPLSLSLFQEVSLTFSPTKDSVLCGFLLCALPFKIQ